MCSVCGWPAAGGFGPDMNVKEASKQPEGLQALIPTIWISNASHLGDRAKRSSRQSAVKRPSTHRNIDR